MKLYEIDKSILECIDLDTGEILDVERLNALRMERATKIENVALYIKELQAQADAIGAEVKALQERAKAKTAKAERLKQWIFDALNGASFETARVRLSFRSNQKVNIADELSCVEWLEHNGYDNCVKYQMPEISKADVKRLLKAGEIIPGAVLEDTTHLQMK